MIRFVVGFFFCWLGFVFGHFAGCLPALFSLQTGERVRSVPLEKRVLLDRVTSDAGFEIVAGRGKQA